MSEDSVEVRGMRSVAVQLAHHAPGHVTVVLVHDLYGVPLSEEDMNLLERCDQAIRRYSGARWNPGNPVRTSFDGRIQNRAYGWAGKGRTTMIFPPGLRPQAEAFAQSHNKLCRVVLLVDKKGIAPDVSKEIPYGSPILMSVDQFEDRLDALIHF